MTQKASYREKSFDAETSVGLLRRLGAIFYDFLILLALVLIITAVWTGIGVVFGHPWYPIYLISIYLFIFLYFGWCWTHGGQSVGMKTWKIRLVSLRQTPFTWTQAISRSSIAFVSFAFLGLGFLWILFRRDKMAWHDLFSDSRLIAVVKRNR